MQAARFIFVFTDGAELWNNFEKRIYQFSTPGMYLVVGASL